MVPVTLDDVRALALSLPRSYEAVVRGRVKFRVGQIVYVAFSQDEETMGFGFPKELRDALVQSEPHKFSLPSQSDMRFNWATCAWPQSTRTRCVTSSRVPGRCACRSASPRSTRPRRGTRSAACDTEPRKTPLSPCLSGRRSWPEPAGAHGIGDVWLQCGYAWRASALSGWLVALRSSDKGSARRAALAASAAG